MTNGRSAAAVGMASFMTKKKKYKFQVDICLEELLEVPFISAVLFAKLRLLDGGSFQDHSSRYVADDSSELQETEEVKDHKVSWGAKFTFPCKMMANASTGVLERCVLRISIRKESKGGRSFNKLGFVDLNLAEYAGSGTIFKKALLEGYDARHRQDNSLLKFSIAMNMLSGDVLFKVPSPSPRPKSATAEEPPSDQRTDEYSGGSLGGSIASGSSGFGSLPKKRPALLSSELVIGQKLSENNIPVTVASDFSDATQVPLEFEDFPLGEPGHSRNSSNTSQLSKASGYSSIHSHSHSRQSSSGDSGHIRKLHSSLRIASFYKSSKFSRNNSFPTKNSLISHSNVPSIPSTIPSEREAVQKTLVNKKLPTIQLSGDDSVYSTPNSTFTKQISNSSTSSNEEYKTPQSTASEHRSDVFSKSFHEIQKSFSMTVVEFGGDVRRESNGDALHLEMPPSYGSDNVVLRSKSDYELGPISSKKSWLSAKIPESLYAFLTPSPQRKNVPQSTPTRPVTVSNPCRVPSYPQTKQSLQSLPESTRSLNCLQIGGTATGETNGQPLGVQPVRRQHRKLLDCSSAGGKLTPLAISPDESNQPQTDSAPQNSQVTVRRPSGTTNPSSSSLALSETGSLDRAKAAYERRKKTQLLDCDNVQVTGRVENTRVNPDHLIEDLLKNTNLEPVDDEAETSGLQLFIAKDGTAALGNHEVKSQMSTGVQLFKQVVMDDNR